MIIVIFYLFDLVREWNQTFIIPFLTIWVGDG